MQRLEVSGTIRPIYGSLGFKRLSSSLCNFLHSSVTSSLLGPNILLNTLFSNTLSLRSSLNASDQVSHLDALPPWNNPSTQRIGTGWVTGLVWTIRRPKMSLGPAKIRTRDHPRCSPVTRYTELSWFPLMSVAMALVTFMLSTMADIPRWWIRLCNGIAKRDRFRNCDIPHAAKPAVGIASSDPMIGALDLHRASQD